MTPEPLFFENEAFALPAFRIFAFVDLPLADPAMKAAALRIMDLFLAVGGEQVAFVARSGGRIKTLKPEPVTPETLAETRGWLASDPLSWPSTLRFNGWPGAPLNIASPPHLRIEQGAHEALFQIELDAQAPGLVAFADAVGEVLADLPVICGAMGMGVYLPAAKSSLLGELPRIFPRYRCAIEVQPEQAAMGLRRDEGMAFYRMFPDLLPGIADIGWRTLLGREFTDRLPDLGGLDGAGGIEIRRQGLVTTVCAGSQPIWGDVNRAEDISTYREVARALAPVRMQRDYVLRWLFGSNHDDPEAVDRLEAWQDRLG